MKYFPVVCLFLLTFALRFACGQSKQIKRIDGSTISSRKLDQEIARLMDTARVTGLALAIIADNQVAYLKTYGYRNKALRKPLAPHTVFYGASFSKAVFAYLVMQLVEEGRLDLDKPVHQYLPKPLPAYEKYADLAADARWQMITARMLLSHSSGFPNWRWLSPGGGETLNIHFTPGTQYAYSGEGLTLLQLVVEEITATPLETLARERIFKPFGMHRTSYLWQPRFEANYALGYDKAEKPLRKKKRTETNAAGSLETTLHDYATFISAVMQGKRLKQSTRDLMLTPQIEINSRVQFPTLPIDTTSANKNIRLAYGLGWGLFETRYGKAFFKEGHDDGWEHYNVNFEDQDISIILMTNSSNGESIFRELLELAIGDVYTPWRWETYTPYNLPGNVPE